MAQRGRPKGSNSFVNVNMETLNKLFGQGQNIPVSRIWLKKLDIVVDAEEKTKVRSEPSAASDTKIEMTLQA